jgi:hypothetical protein
MQADLPGQEQNAVSVAPFPDSGVDTGALIPRDMTVRLVRADSANWEVFLQALYSLLLTFFGIFLGGWINDAGSSAPRFTGLEKTATVIFGVLALVLIGAWVVLKIKQHKKNVKIPYEILRSFQRDE